MAQSKQTQTTNNLDTKVQGCGVLDYKSQGWYFKSCKYIQNTTTKSCFVSTNSVVQGEQHQYCGD